jgi:hypothetical protein
MILSVVPNSISTSVLIQRGGGTGPMKPRQPDWLQPIFGANSGRRTLLEDESDGNVANSLFSGRGFFVEAPRVSHLSRDPFLIPGHRMGY